MTAGIYGNFTLYRLYQISHHTPRYIWEYHGEPIVQIMTECLYTHQLPNFDGWRSSISEQEIQWMCSNLLVCFISPGCVWWLSSCSFLIHFSTNYPRSVNLVKIDKFTRVESQWQQSTGQYVHVYRKWMAVGCIWSNVWVVYNNFLNSFCFHVLLTLYGQ